MIKLSRYDFLDILKMKAIPNKSKNDPVPNECIHIESSSIFNKVTATVMNGYCLHKQFFMCQCETDEVFNLYLEEIEKPNSKVTDIVLEQDEKTYSVSYYYYSKLLSTWVFNKIVGEYYNYNKLKMNEEPVKIVAVNPKQMMNLLKLYTDDEYVKLLMYQQNNTMIRMESQYSNRESVLMPVRT